MASEGRWVGSGRLDFPLNGCSVGQYPSSPHMQARKWVSRGLRSKLICNSVSQGRLGASGQGFREICLGAPPFQSNFRNSVLLLLHFSDPYITCLAASTTMTSSDSPSGSEAAVDQLQACFLSADNSKYFIFSWSMEHSLPYCYGCVIVKVIRG